MEFLVLAGAAIFIWWIVRRNKQRRVSHPGAAARSEPLASDFMREERSERGRGVDGDLRFDIGAGIDAGFLAARQARGSALKRSARWVDPNETVEIAGVTVKGGLIYVGTNLPTQSGYETDNCLINPELMVAGNPVDDESGLPYWPAYHRISPSQRLAYLRWLARGRDDPATDIGYVFLYFYGLERRFFLDRPEADTVALVDEVVRLLTVYGDNRSFSSYAENFLASVTFAGGHLPAFPSLSPEKAGLDLSPILRAAIGKRLAEGKRLTWDWVLAWFLGHPETYLRTPASRCFEEFKSLFEIRFRDRYPDGLAVRMPKKLLRAHYSAASNTFVVPIENDLGEIPDPVDLKVPIRVAGELAEQITADLDSYSRYLGRNPDAKETLPAQLLLPAGLPRNSGSALGALEAFVDERLSGSTAAVSLQDLLGVLGIDDGGAKPSANTMKMLSKALAACDIGMEPDRACGAQAVDRHAVLVLFRAAGGGLVDPSRQSFAVARILVELATIAIMADGVADDSEIAVAIEGIKKHSDLLALERVRLLALLSAFVQSPPQQQALLRRLAKAEESVRDEAAQMVLGIIAADGRLDADEIAFAEKLFKTLRLPDGRLYSSLHALGATSHADGPVTVAKAEPTSGYPVPKPPAEERRSDVVHLDPALVAAKRQETVKVSALLASVFADEEQSEPPVGMADAGSHDDRRYDGLDAAHAGLVDALLSNEELGRSDFEVLCRKAGLFAAGAIETINDWSFDAFDDALIEDGDPIVIDPELLAPLMEKAEAAP